MSVCECVSVCVSVSRRYCTVTIGTGRDRAGGAVAGRPRPLPALPPPFPVPSMPAPAMDPGTKPGMEEEEEEKEEDGDEEEENASPQPRGAAGVGRVGEKKKQNNNNIKNKIIKTTTTTTKNTLWWLFTVPYGCRGRGGGNVCRLLNRCTHYVRWSHSHPRRASPRRCTISKLYPPVSPKMPAPIWGMVTLPLSHHQRQRFWGTVCPKALEALLRASVQGLARSKTQRAGGSWRAGTPAVQMLSLPQSPCLSLPKPVRIFCLCDAWDAARF